MNQLDIHDALLDYFLYPDAVRLGNVSEEKIRELQQETLLRIRNYSQAFKNRILSFFIAWIVSKSVIEYGDICQNIYNAIADAGAKEDIILNPEDIFKKSYITDEDEKVYPVDVQNFYIFYDDWKSTFERWYRERVMKRRLDTARALTLGSRGLPDDISRRIAKMNLRKKSR